MVSEADKVVAGLRAMTVTLVKTMENAASASPSRRTLGDQGARELFDRVLVEMLSELEEESDAGSREG